MITDSQVGVPRPTGLRRTETKPVPGLIGLVTNHYVAKIVALLFAAVLIILIDRELESVLRDAEFDVRVGELSEARGVAPGRGQILLDTEPGIAVRFAKPTSVRVVIKGQQKLADQLKAKTLVGVVLIKADWLKVDSQGLRHSISRTIEGTDVQIVGLRGVTITLDPPIQVDLDPEVTKEIPLKAIPKDVAPGLAAEVTFEPAKIRVRGPESLFMGAGAIEQIPIEIPAGGRREEFTHPVLSLPEALVHKQVRMAPDQQINARVRFTKAVAQDTLEVKDVPIKTVSSGGVEAEYSFEIIGLPKQSVTIVLSGPPKAVAYWKEHPDELKRLIRAEFDADKLVNKANPQPGTAASEYAAIEVVLLPDDLKQVSVTPAQVEVSVKKK
jgi:hypothetical protein